MTPHDLTIATSGAILLGYGLIALFFLRFWRKAHERLFLWFALAFVILAVERMMILILSTELVHYAPLYCTRLLAFLVIVTAIWDKNRSDRR